MTRLVLALVMLAPNGAALRAERHFEAGEFEDAIVALREAYAAEPDPKYVFAEGSALQELGRCEEAIETWERFLALAPPKAHAQTAFERIQACRAELDAAPEPAPAPAPEPSASVAPAPRSVPVDRGPRPWHRDPTGGVLLGAGAAATVTGGILLGVGLSQRAAATDAATEADFRDGLRGTNTLQGVGIALAVTGGALLVGAIVRYVIVRRRGRAMARRRISAAARN